MPLALSRDSSSAYSWGQRGLEAALEMGCMTGRWPLPWRPWSSGSAVSWDALEAWAVSLMFTALANAGPAPSVRVTTWD